ncbi:MAG: Uma2 family endonuclease [Chloroflexota bacterium]
MAMPSPRRLFTVDEYYKMAEVGIIKPGERVELLDGEIVPMSPIGSPHAWCVKRLIEIFAPLIGMIRLSVQDPLRLGARAEPEPDVVIVRADAPEDRHPGPAEALLVIEVSDTSIQTDRGRKRLMYARAGIPDYWIVDLDSDRLEVYREPSPRGYRSAALLSRGNTVSPLFAPDIAIDVATILGRVRTEE